MELMTMGKIHLSSHRLGLSAIVIMETRDLIWFLVGSLHREGGRSEVFLTFYNMTGKGAEILLSLDLVRLPWEPLWSFFPMSFPCWLALSRFVGGLGKGLEI